MIGLTAIISSILGVLSAAIPKGFEYVDKKMTFQQELAIRKMEAEAREKEQAFALQAQTLQAQAKVEEAYYGTVAQVDASAHQYAEQTTAQLTKPTGYAFVDLLNAVIRPVVIIYVMTLFGIATTSWMFGFGVVTPEFGREMGVLLASSVDGVLYFVLGRSAVRMPGILSGKK